MTGSAARATGSALLVLATVLGVWLGITAPDTSPVTPAGDVVLVDDGGGGR